MRTTILALLLVLFPGLSHATTLKEAPWLPEAAAYRLTLFMGNLSPLPWQKLRDNWEEPATGAKPVIQAIKRVDAEQLIILRTALINQDRQALFEVSTRIVAANFLKALEAAEKTLGQPAAKQHVSRAQGLYRAFADGIKAGDPKAERRLGLAWLKMTSALGSSGVLGAGQSNVDKQAFAEASASLKSYISNNYDPESFSKRVQLTPVPESIVAQGIDVKMPIKLPPGSNITNQNPLPRLVLQFEGAGIEETDLPLVAYGDMLFDSPQIFGGPARELKMSCATCHNRSDVNRDFFIPGLSNHAGGMDVDGSFFNPLFNDRKDDHLDTPSMRGIRFTAPYGRDGREASLRRFTRNVIVTEFAGEEPTPFMLDALVAYMREFDFLPNPKIDREGRLTNKASEAAKRGEIIFNTPFEGMSEKSCASCHVPDRNFRDGKQYDIGSEKPAGTNTATQFDTPTLRSVNFSAPYFHDGSLPTLRSVVEWFNISKQLGLGEQEIADLTAYVEAVGDGEEPYQVFEGKDSVFRLAFDELTTFATTLNTLLPMKDQRNIDLLVRTVAPDLKADASTMTNQSAKSEVYALADLLQAVGDAANTGNWESAEQNWAAFQSLQNEIDERMY